MSDGYASDTERLEVIDPMADLYCMTCYEVVRLGQSTLHRDVVHDGLMAPDIVPIQATMGEGFIAQASGMGHFSPHVWMDVDDHEMCGECGAVKVKPEDVPDSLVTDTERGER